MRYYGRARAGVHLPFNFQLVDAPWEPCSLARLIADYEAALPPGGWPNWALGSHVRLAVAAKLGGARLASPRCSCSPFAAPPSTSATSLD